jgi:hypothetical protein
MSQAPNFDAMNETDVREILVRPLIERLGYAHGTDATILTEKTLRYDRAFLGRKKPNDPALIGRADYICEVISYGRWVVEVKAPSEELSHDVTEQAHTYASHPEIASSFFMVTNGRRFRLFQTSKLDAPVLEWRYEDQDDNLLRLLNTLSPEAIRKRARMILVDPSKPLGRGVPSRVIIIRGEITYEEHIGDHPFFPRDAVNGLVLAVTGGYVKRAEDKRIIAHLCIAKAAALIQGISASPGASEDYDFFSASEYLSDDPEHPTIFQNLVKTAVPAGRFISIPGLPKVPLPFAMSNTAFTEAVGYVRDNKFVGTMSLTYDFTFSELSPNTRVAFFHKMGAIPERAHIIGAGRFEISFQPDI